MIHKHNFLPSHIENYEACGLCGTMHRIGEVNYDDFYLNQYWDRENVTPLELQPYNLTQIRNEKGESKIDSVLKYVSNGDSVLEIAAAPGILLTELCKQFNNVVGVEYDPSYEARIRAICGDKPHLIFKPFPRATKSFPANKFDCILGLDIFEHIAQGEDFVNEIHRLFKPNGTCVLMSPFIFNDGKFEPKNYHEEHLRIYSEEFLMEFLGEKFHSVSFDRFIVGHEIVVISGKR